MFRRIESLATDYADCNCNPSVRTGPIRRNRPISRPVVAPVFHGDTFPRGRSPSRTRYGLLVGHCADGRGKPSFLIHVARSRGSFVGRSAGTGVAGRAVQRRVRGAPPTGVDGPRGRQGHAAADDHAGERSLAEAGRRATVQGAVPPALQTHRRPRHAPGPGRGRAAPQGGQAGWAET